MCDTTDEPPSDSESEADVNGAENWSDKNSVYFCNEIHYIHEYHH
jgi:hypothetical protein